MVSSREGTFTEYKRQLTISFPTHSEIKHSRISKGKFDSSLPVIFDSTILVFPDAKLVSMIRFLFRIFNF